MTSHETTYAVSERVEWVGIIIDFIALLVRRSRDLALDSVREHVNVKIALEPGNASVISLEYRPK